MELKQLKYFAGVAEALHFSNAAKKLYVSQSALSQQIQLLENELGVDLFKRRERVRLRKVELTEAGTVFLIEAKQILLMCDKAVETARRIGSHKKEFRFGIFKTFLKERVELIEIFKSNFPEVNLKIIELDLHWDVQKALNEDRLDVGFTFMPLRHNDLSFKSFRSDHHSILMPHNHKLAQEDFIHLSDLKNEKWIVIGNMVNPVFEELESACVAAGFSRKDSIVQSVNSLELAFSLVGLGLGIAFVPAFIETDTNPKLVKKRILNADKTPFTAVDVDLGIAYKTKTSNPLAIAYVGLINDLNV